MTRDESGRILLYNGVFVADKYEGFGSLFEFLDQDGSYSAERWNEKRTERLDFINEQLKKEHHAVNEFDDADTAMKQYYYISGRSNHPFII